MDDERFDGIIRVLGSGATRRGALGLLAGAAGLGLGETAAKKRRRRRVRGQAAGVGKVTLCHHDQDADTWFPITISKNAEEHHKANHGDFEFAGEDQCCTNADCDENEECVIEVDEEGTGSGTCQQVVCTPAEVCSAGQTVNCGFGGCAQVQDVDGGCACVERICSFQSCSTGSECGSGLCISAPGCCGSTIPFCGTPCAAAAARGAEEATSGGWR